MFDHASRPRVRDAKDARSLSPATTVAQRSPDRSLMALTRAAIQSPQEAASAPKGTRVVWDGLPERLDARAVTVGTEIHLARGESADADDGRLVRHELAHVFQQAGRPTSGPIVIAPDTHAEEQADLFARGQVDATSLSPSVSAPRESRIAQLQPKATSAKSRKAKPKGGNILYIGTNEYKP